MYAVLISSAIAILLIADLTFIDRAVTMSDHPDVTIHRRDLVIIAGTGDKMKVSELKEGMLLRFKEPRIYKFLQDRDNSFWFDCGALDPRMTLKWVQRGQPLMIYLGQEKMKDRSHYGGYFNVRKVSVEGRTAWMFPDTWKYVESV